MPDPTWPSSPPEVNYLRLAGAGAGGTATTMASAAAWQALAVGNEAAASVSTLNTVATAVNFEGVGGTSSAATVTGLNASLHLLAGWAQEKSPIAMSAVAAYETAVSSMIPAEVSMANRAEQAADVALNPLVLGALTPMIVALDAEYFGEHWPHNASAGVLYGTALAALAAALAVPPPVSPPGASSTAPITAAAAVARGAGQVAAGEALKESGQAAKLAGDGAAVPAEAAGQAGSMLAQPIQAAAGALQPVLGMFQSPVQAAQGLTGLPQSLLGSVGGRAGSALAAEPEIPLGLLGAVGAGGGAAGIGTGGGAGAGSIGAASVGAGGGGVGGGVPGAGLTSFTRPTSSFTPENGGGRPVGLKPGLLGAAELKAPGASAMSGAAMPLSPAHAGMLGQGKEPKGAEDVVRVRVVLPGGQPAGGST